MWPIYETQTGTTSPGQSGLGSNCNEEVTSHFQELKSSVCNLVSYPGHCIGLYIPTEERDE